MLNREELNALFGYCLSLTRERQSAEDLLHNGVEKLLRSKAAARNPVSYTRTIIRNLFIDQCRRNKIVSFETLDDDAPLILNERDLEEVWLDRDHIDKLLDQLGVAERETLFLWAVAGYTSAEIAAEIDVPRGTVLARLHRIKQKLNVINFEQNLSGGW